MQHCLQDPLLQRLHLLCISLHGAPANTLRTKPQAVHGRTDSRTAIAMTPCIMWLNCITLVHHACRTPSAGDSTHCCLFKGCTAPLVHTTTLLGNSYTSQAMSQARKKRRPRRLQAQEQSSEGQPILSVTGRAVSSNHASSTHKGSMRQRTVPPSRQLVVLSRNTN